MQKGRYLLEAYFPFDLNYFWQHTYVACPSQSKTLIEVEKESKRRSVHKVFRLLITSDINILYFSEMRKSVT